MDTTDTILARPGPIHAPAAFGLLVFVLICASRAVLNDGDTYTHVAAGEWMLDHGAVLTSDPLTATFAGQPWHAHEWLAEVLLAAAYRLAGLTGVVLLTAAAAGVTFANLARHVGRWCSWTATIMLTTAAVICVAPSMLARPHILALPVLELWIADLLMARAEQRAPSWWTLGLMLAWANLHGGYAFGIGLALALAVEASVGPDRRHRTTSRWWLFVIGAVVAAAATPQGLSGLTFPIRLLHSQSLALINEWQPTNLAKNVGFEVAVLGVVVVLASGKVRMPWFRSLMLIGLLHLAFMHVRHTMLFGIVGTLLMAEPVGRAFGGPAQAAVTRSGWLCWPAVAAVVLCRLAAPVAMADSRVTPVSALAQVPVAWRQTPVLNSSHFGGYLALMGFHPFIDGRVELFGDEFVAEYVAMSKPDTLARGVAHYGIGWALLAADDPMVQGFDGFAGWRRWYADETSVIFVGRSLQPLPRQAREVSSVEQH